MRVFALALLLVAALAAEPKIIGTRTAENLPTTWTVHSDVEDSKEVPFIVALHQQNLEKLEQIFWDVSNPDHSNYRDFMTIDQITSLVAPPVQDTKKVMRWLVDGGAEILENRGDSIYAKATVAVASRLFSTSFKNYQHESGKQIVRQFGEFSVPAEVAGFVDFVAGLSEFPIGKFKAIKQKGYFNPETAVTIAPQTIQVIYGTANAEVTGNSSAGVIEFEDQYYSPSDLSQFASQFSVKIPALTPNHIVGSNQPSNPQIEATLDIQYILGVATDAQGWFWIEADPIWLYGFATHMFGRKDVPLVNSISYGWNEEAQCQDGIGGSECQQLGLDNTQYVKRINIEFQKIGIRGVTIFTASGDSGANGRTDYYCTEDHLNPVFPGASPYVTSVGATQISDASGVANLPNPPPGCSGLSCASGGTEQAVSFDQAHFASGGGFSNIAPAPAYQKPFIEQYLKSGVALPPSSYYNAAGRGFPDVSAFGSQVLILSQGSIEPVGGTSASSPIFAGVVSLLNDYVNTKTGKPLGHVAPLLYKIASADPSCFNDITVGDNICTEAGCSSSCKGFTCAKGWDPVSGLGTPKYPCLLNYIKANIVKETN